MNSIEEIVARNKARNQEDAERYKALDEDTCQLCQAQGEDKRNLYIACLYDVQEVVPEAISLQQVLPDSDTRQDFFYLRLCKGCRGRLLGKMAQWREECLALRNMPKDSDGNVEPTQPGQGIPVRVNGAIEWLTEGEWHERERRLEAERHG